MQASSSTQLMATTMSTLFLESEKQTIYKRVAEASVDGV